MAASAQKKRLQTMTKEKSFLHTKRMLAIAVSSIAYMRHLFPDGAFAERQVDDMRVRILKKDETTGTKQLIDWMSGVYEALEKEYLRKFLLAISYTGAESGKEILETYNFTFSYTDASVSTDIEMMKDGMSIKSTPLTAEDTKKSAQKFIRKLFSIVQSFDTIKSSFSVTTRLMYNDSKPMQYQPPGFEAAEEDDFEMNDEIYTANIGKMQAPYHTMQLVIRQVHGRMKSISNEENQMQMHLPSQVTVVETAPPCDKVPLEQNTQSAPITQTQNTQGLGVRCPCGYNEDDGSMMMCVFCRYWQHAICFCLTEDIGFLSVHICNFCADANNPDLYPTDVTLMDWNENQLREVCMWRRALRACYETTRVNVTSLSGRLSCSKVLAKSIVDKLVLEGVAKPVKGHRSFKDIDRVNLDSVFYRDVKKLALDMRKQIVEAKANASHKGTPEVRRPLVPVNDDETPMKMNDSPSAGTRSAKRRLGIDSQDSVFQPPAAPAKSKKTKRTK